MRAESHGAWGAASAWLLAQHLPLWLRLIGVAAGALGGVLPDAEHVDSFAGRFIPDILWMPVKVPITRHGVVVFTRNGRRIFGHTVWHRQEGHSIAAGMAVSHPFLLLAPVLLVAPHVITHPAPTVALALYLLPIVLPVVSGCLFVGYLSHLLLDMFNPSGVWLFWPLSRRSFRFLFTIREASWWGKKLDKVALAAAGLTVVAQVISSVQWTPAHVMLSP